MLERFQTLSQRERIFALATVLVLLWAIWDHLLYQPVKRQLVAVEQELDSAKNELKTQQQSAQQLKSSQPVDPNFASRNLITSLTTEHSRLQEQLSLGGKKFVPARLMASALQDMLSQNQQLKLLKLNTLPVKTLLPSEHQEHPIYVHGLAISFSGNYLDTLAYLKSLEALPWHFVWESIDYKVTNYPVAETTLRTYTLSFEESWLGI